MIFVHLQSSGAVKSEFCRIIWSGCASAPRSPRIRSGSGTVRPDPFSLCRGPDHNPEDRPQDSLLPAGADGYLEPPLFLHDHTIEQARRPRIVAMQGCSLDVINDMGRHFGEICDGLVAHRVALPPRVPDVKVCYNRPRFETMSIRKDMSVSRMQTPLQDPPSPRRRKCRQSQCVAINSKLASAAQFGKWTFGSRHRNSRAVSPAKQVECGITWRMNG